MTSPLRPELYKRLQGRLGPVTIVNEGEAFQGFVSWNPVKKRHELQATWPGEYYATNCAFCNDTRQRLWINHRWGLYVKELKSDNLWLAICYNENCLSVPGRALQLKDLIFNDFLNGRQPDPVLPGRVMSSEEIREARLPAPNYWVPTLDRLPANHPACTYLRQRCCTTAFTAKESFMLVPRKYLSNPHDPFQEPDRRHRRCQFLLEHGWPPISKDDAITREAWWFRRDLQRCRNDTERERVACSYPTLAQVHLFVQNATMLQRAELEARLLADESDECIAGHCNLSPAAVHQYHELYFQVRPYLQSQCYILNVAIGPKALHGLRSDDHDVLLKLAGYTQGAGAVDQLLVYLADPPVWPAALAQFDDPALETLRERFLMRAWILSLTMPAYAATAAQLPAIRALLAQGGVLGKGSVGAEIMPLSAVHAGLDYRAFLCEAEAGTLHPAALASTEVAPNICEWVGSAISCPSEWQAVPA